MKLRNKNTGKIVDLTEGFITDTGGGEYITIRPVAAFYNDDYDYDTLAKLCEEWEDYTLPEPLIKDEKIRKAVRAWAEACEVEKCNYNGDGDFATKWYGITLDCTGENLKEGTYTITELCGEES